MRMESLTNASELITATFAATISTTPVTSYTTNVVITAFVAVFLLVGTAGNILTILVISYTKSLHTASNLFIVSLCVSDLTSALVCSPLWLYRRTWGFYNWEWGAALCRFYWISDFTTNYVTSLHIVSFAGLRFYAVKKPFKVAAITERKVLVYICFLWILSLGIAMPLIAYMDVAVGRENETIGSSWPSCSIMDQEHCCVKEYNLYMTIISPLVFYVPEVCVIILSALIAKALLKRSRWRNNASRIYSVSGHLQQTSYALNSRQTHVIANSQVEDIAQPRSRDTTFSIPAQLAKLPPIHVRKFHVSLSSPKKFYKQRISHFSWHATRSGRDQQTLSQAHQQELQYHRERNTFTQLGLIIIAFIVGYVPLTVYLLWTSLTPKGLEQNVPDYWFGVVSYLCLRLSECMNPVMYNLGSTKIRVSTKLFLEKTLSRFK